jgi:hypothetical protein
MTDYFCNGIVIQQQHGNRYRGIDGENWYLNYLSTDNYFREFYDRFIARAWEGCTRVDCCNDLEYITRYISCSHAKEIDCRLLLCETVREDPKMELSDYAKARFIGFDYAYSGGDYYSCVKNDICLRRIPEFSEIKLNEYGLFDSETAVQAFIELRAEIRASYSASMFELGDFIIYRLSELELTSIENAEIASDWVYGRCIKQ